MDNPYILYENNDFAVVFKPPKMHTTQRSNIKEEKTKNKETYETLFEWYLNNSSSVFDVMHRLDFETHGLVLFAKNEKTYNFLKSAQDKGEFVKEYSAVCILAGNENNLEGFPEFKTNLSGSPLIIESYFRPYGPGRKLVRPIIDYGKKHKEIAKDKGGFYRTEISNIDGSVFTVRIKRGFRHQIRCHLCWAGFPILNDPLYSCQTNQEPLPPSEIHAASVLSYSNDTMFDKLIPYVIRNYAFCDYQNRIGQNTSILALRSHALFFPDPFGGKQCEFKIDPFT